MQTMQSQCDGFRESYLCAPPASLPHTEPNAFKPLSSGRGRSFLLQKCNPTPATISQIIENNVLVNFLPLTNLLTQLCRAVPEVSGFLLPPWRHHPLSRQRIQVSNCASATISKQWLVVQIGSVEAFSRTPQSWPADQPDLGAQKLRKSSPGAVATWS